MTPEQKRKLYTAAIERLMLDKHKGYKTVGAVAGGLTGAGVGGTVGLAKTINRHRNGELDELDTKAKITEYLKAMGGHAGVGLGAGAALGAGAGELGRRWSVRGPMQDYGNSLSRIAENAPENISRAGKYIYRQADKDTKNINLADKVKENMLARLNKRATHISPSKILQDAYLKERLKAALISGTAGGLVHGGLSGLSTLQGSSPDGDSSMKNAIKNGLISGGIGAATWGAIGASTAKGKFRERLENHRAGGISGMRVSNHDKKIIDEVLELRKAYRQKHGIRSSGIEDVHLKSMGPSRGRRGHQLANDLARNASKLKPDSVNDVIVNGYKAPAPKFSKEEIEHMKRTAKPVNMDPITGVYSDNIPQLKAGSLDKQAFNIRVPEDIKQKYLSKAHTQAYRSKGLSKTLADVEKNYINGGTLAGAGIGGIYGGIRGVSNVAKDPETGEPAESKLKAGLKGALLFGTAGGILGRTGGKALHATKEPKIFEKYHKKEVERILPDFMDDAKVEALRLRLMCANMRDAGKADNFYRAKVKKMFPDNPDNRTINHAIADGRGKIEDIRKHRASPEYRRLEKREADLNKMDSDFGRKYEQLSDNKFISPGDALRFHLKDMQTRTQLDQPTHWRAKSEAIRKEIKESRKPAKDLVKQLKREATTAKDSRTLSEIAEDEAFNNQLIERLKS